MIARKNLWNAAGLTAALLATQGCATLFGKPQNNERILAANASIPAAEGKVAFGLTKEANTSIDMQIKHLAPPEKLTPPSKAYVVWAMRKNGTPENIGALSLDNDLAAVFHNEIPLHGFALFLTAEPSGEVIRPTGPPSMWAVY